MCRAEMQQKWLPLGGLKRGLDSRDTWQDGCQLSAGSGSGSGSGAGVGSGTSSGTVLHQPDSQQVLPTTARWSPNRHQRLAPAAGREPQPCGLSGQQLALPLCWLPAEAAPADGSAEPWGPELLAQLQQAHLALLRATGPVSEAPVQLATRLEPLPSLSLGPLTPLPTDKRQPPHPAAELGAAAEEARQADLALLLRLQHKLQQLLAAAQEQQQQQQPKPDSQQLLPHGGQQQLLQPASAPASAASAPLTSPQPQLTRSARSAFQEWMPRHV